MHIRQLAQLDRLLVIRKAAFGIVSLILPLLAGCGMLGGSPDDPMQALREQIQSTVTDEQRTEAMFETVDTIDQLLIESAAVMHDAAIRERALFLDYDSTRQDYNDLFFETRNKRVELQRQLLAAHLDFKSQSTAEEWDVLSSAQANAVSTKLAGLLSTALERD